MDMAKYHLYVKLFISLYETKLSSCYRNKI